MLIRSSCNFIALTFSKTFFGSSASKSGFQLYSTVDDLTSGRAKIDSLRPISIEDLRQRFSFSRCQSSLYCHFWIRGFSYWCEALLVLSFLAKSSLSPSKLIILDNSEPSLYAIDHQLRQSFSRDVSIETILGDACDEDLLAELFIKHSVDIVVCRLQACTSCSIKSTSRHFK